jgi:hypothetical protein
MTKFNFTCNTNDIPELYRGASHYVRATAELKTLQDGTQGWYTIYELVLTPMQSIQIMEEYEDTTYDVMLKTIYFAERGWVWHKQGQVPALSSAPFDSVATELWTKRVGLMLADDRVTEAMFTDLQRIINYLRVNKFVKEVASEAK